jgi:uncharacterized membrane protein YdcZ (DUF606 family)
MIAILLRVIVFFVGVYFSYEHAEDYWVVGPVFGSVVLFWQYSIHRKLQIPKAVAFFVSSTLIYALVRYMFDFEITGKIDEVAHFSAPVLAGTILLPIAYKLMMGCSWKRVYLAVPAIYVLWHLSGFLLEKLALDSNVEPWINHVMAWQAVYLIAMFYPQWFYKTK